MVSLSLFVVADVAAHINRKQNYTTGKRTKESIVKKGEKKETLKESIDNFEEGKRSKS